MKVPDTSASPALAIHGGAGTILREKLTPEKEQEYRKTLAVSVEAGWAVLVSGGTGLDAVQAAINVMEDSPLFNAGKGAVFTHEGRNEQDACIMDGATRNAGAVAAVRRIRNPINLARLVMDHSPHLLLAGDGAEAFAVAHGMDLVEAEYFYTEHRWTQLQEALAKEASLGASKDTVRLDHSVEDKIGTVGAVALDSRGNLAAATSTGGMTNKRYGRIGDSPIIGAGTYADNAACAVSTTGVGEYFMRALTAYDIAAMMQYAHLPLDQACAKAMERLAALGGSGGLIALDRLGNVAMPFNSKGMYRAWRNSDVATTIKIFQE
jgi:beta-aspartyl-peptidase (threonine type)